MPASVLNDRYWLLRYRLMPDQVAQLPLEDYEWFPLIDQAENVAAERSRPKEPR